MTGIPITSLHAWERRYGFPHSLARTMGGHRLYSEKDVTLLRLVKAQIDQGITARQAVIAVHKMDIEGRLPTQQPIETPRPLAPLSASPAGHAQLAEALFQHDLVRADQLMGELLAFYSPEEITLNIIGPVLAELGEAWAQGRITVADEHLASNYLRQRLLMWPVVYLGQDVPFADLANLIDQIRPGALVLVGMLAESAGLLAGWPQSIKQTAGRPLVAFAGRAFVLQPELQEQVQGLYLGDTIQAGLARLEEKLLQQR